MSASATVVWLVKRARSERVSVERRHQPRRLQGFDRSRQRPRRGNMGPEGWKPAYSGDWCRYASYWVTIKKKWSLTVAQAEYHAPACMLTTC
jgi:hypothetical protein